MKKILSLKVKIFIPVTEEFVLRELSKLNTNKSTGIDNIQAKFLKDGAHELKGVITHIINVYQSPQITHQIY